MKGKERILSVLKNEFKDFSFSERLEKRSDKKIKNLRFHALIKELKAENGFKEMTDNSVERISTCGSFLEFIGDKDLENTKLIRANFCGNRFCPHCSYNLSKKHAMATYIIVEYLSADYDFIFLTLTAPNVPGYVLEKEIKSFNESFKRLAQIKRFKDSIKGYIRKFEVTYNSSRNDYHPHFHVLLAVDKDYFSSDKFIEQKEWLNMWRKAKRDETITQVDVRKFNKDNDTGILELTKYIAKDSDYLNSSEVFYTFYTSLKSKMFYSYSGVFKEARSLLKNGKLDYLRLKDETEYIYKLWFVWKNKEYTNINFEMLTPDELAKYNINYMNEVQIE